VVAESRKSSTQVIGSCVLYYQFVETYRFIQDLAIEFGGGGNMKCMIMPSHGVDGKPMILNHALSKIEPGLYTNLPLLNSLS
jgi:hypothetical protein